MNQPIQPLLPDDNEVPRRVFTSGSQLASFRHAFHESIKPRLEQLKKARQESEDDAKSHWLR
jgi:hypothetical protein